MIELTSGTVTQEQLNNTDLEQVTYKGISVMELIYEKTNFGGDIIDSELHGEFTGQECYLGYSASENAFYMVLEGELHAEASDEDEDECYDNASIIIKIITDGENVNCKIDEQYYGLFYGKEDRGMSNLKKLHARIPDLVDIRLD